MKAIEGVSLQDEIKAVNQASLEEQKAKLREKIKNVLGAHSVSAGTVTKCRKDLEKAEASHAKHVARLQKLEAGDWNVLDEKVEGGGKPADAPAAE
jgi:hypothetical protein